MKISDLMFNLEKVKIEYGDLNIILFKCGDETNSPLHKDWMCSILDQNEQLHVLEGCCDDNS